MMLAARENALDALGFELQPAQMVEAVRRASVQADAIRLTVLQAAKQTPACSKGCSWCCSHKVGVTVPEVIAIVAHLRASPERLDAAPCSSEHQPLVADAGSAVQTARGSQCYGPRGRWLACLRKVRQ